MPLTISAATMSTAGVLLLAIVLIEWGGYFMLSLARGRRAATPFQVTFARAGHAHAGVLVILSLVVQLYADAAAIGGILGAVAREAVPLAAILMPVGFFLSSAGAGRTARTPWSGCYMPALRRSPPASSRSESVCSWSDGCLAPGSPG